VVPGRFPRHGEFSCEVEGGACKALLLGQVLLFSFALELLDVAGELGPQLPRHICGDLVGLMGEGGGDGLVIVLAVFDHELVVQRNLLVCVDRFVGGRVAVV